MDASPAGPASLAQLELPPARTPTWPTLAALAAATGLVALGIGAWAVFSARSEPASSLGGTRLEQALAILTDAKAERYPLRKSVGRITLVVGRDDRAVLALDGLAAASDGLVYQAWLVPPGSATPRDAGTFDGAEPVALLTQPIPPGAQVGVTLEPAGGSDRPSRQLRLVAVRG